MSWKNISGPGAMVAAAFIGPGTLTVCTIAGASFGYDLLWVLVFAVLATILLQEMAARLGLITGSGLGEAIRSNIEHPTLKFLSIVLVFIAIIIGNAAYEMGNITGAVLSMEGVFPNHTIWGTLIISSIVFVLLWRNDYKVIQGLLTALVIMMSLVFATTAILVIDDPIALLKGLIPSFSSNHQLMILGLIGTTIVPYNLFLHASSVSKKWNGPEHIPTLRKEAVLTISLGGLISMFVVITSAAAQGGEINGVNAMAVQLEPLLGTWSKTFLSIGLFSAGISSALAAPLAAALTAKGIFGWNSETDWRFRLVWLMILLLGTVFSMFGFKPIAAIQVAQVANGVLLPIIVIFLLILCNKESIMGDYKNKLSQNALGIFVIIIAVIISLRSFNSVFHFLG